MSDKEVNGYTLSRDWWGFSIPKISKLYHMTCNEVDGWAFNESMKLISELRRNRIINWDIAYLSMRIIDNSYEKFRNRGYVKRKKRRSRALIYTSNTSVRDEVFEIHGRACLCCGKSENVTLDHVVPVAKGGGDSVNNLQPLCFTCNRSKGTKVIDYRGSL